jgi:site-specific DNA recombinase
VKSAVIRSLPNGRGRGSAVAPVAWQLFGHGNQHKATAAIGSQVAAVLFLQEMIMIKRAVLYARVSTDHQAGFGYSLQTQLEGCRAYAAANGFEIVAEISDDCSGTIPVIERPGGSELYRHLERDDLSAVILYTLDRTARDERVIEYMLFKATLYDRGVELHYSDNGLDPYTMEGNLLGYIKAHAAADERRKIKERTARGKRAKARAGKWTGTRPPFGYRKVGKGREAYLEIDPTEAEIVRRIYEHYLGRNNRRRWNMLGIAVLLTAEKIPISGRGRKGAKAWTDGTIRYILTNRAYLGEFSYSGITIHLPDLAIIDQETFDAAQQRRLENARQNKRNRKHDYLLVGGFFRCACGCSMIGRVTYGSRSATRYFYYYCGNNGRQYLTDCHEPGVRREWADALVWEWLHRQLSNPENLEQGINEMIERRELELTPKRERLSTINILRAELERQTSALVEALMEATHDDVSATIRNQLKNLGRQLDGLDKERSRLRAEIEMGALNEEELAIVRQVAQKLRTRLKGVDIAARRRLLEELQVQVRLDRDGEERYLVVSCGLSLPVKLSLSLVSGSRSYGGKRAG